MADRTPLDAKVLLASRPELLKAVAAARAATTTEGAKKAQGELAALRSKDPTGGLLALELSRVALKAGDADQAVKSAWMASRFSAGNPKLHKAAVDALQAASAKKGTETVPGATVDGVPTMHAGLIGPVQAMAPICEEVLRRLRGGQVPLLAADASPELGVTCEQDYTLELGHADLQRAVSYKVDVSPKEPEGVRERLIWVTLVTSKGILGWGPVAHVLRPAAGVENDVVADLQHVDVVPGGAPELVVKVMERRTETDVALNEVLKLEQSWVVMLTQDRGKIESSRQIVLDSRTVRDPIDATDRRPAPGGLRASGYGKPADYAMKVAWSGANSITLTKASGNASPFAEGALKLFD